MSPISKKYRKSNILTIERFNQSIGAPVLLGIIFFFVVCLGCADAIKSTVMVVAVFALLVIAVRFKVLRDRIYWPFIALTLVVLMDGISTFYAVSGKFALKEFLKVFLAYLLALILLATSHKNEKITGKRIATLLAVCTAVGSLVSIDMISTRIISGVVTWILGWFTQAYEGLEGVSQGVRITSIYTNSNVFAGVSGLGMLLSFALSDIAASKKERCFFICLLYIDALAFLLALSMGAIVFAIIALSVYLLFQRGEKILNSILLLLEMLITVGISATVISRSSFDSWDGINMIPLLCMVACAVALCMLDMFVIQRLMIRVKYVKKAAVILVPAVIAAGVLYAVLAWHITGSITMDPGTRIDRALYLEPGTYKMDILSNGSVRLVVDSLSKEETMLHTNTRVYSGEAENASFSVPEGSIVTYFHIFAPDGAHIDSASCGEQIVPLRYKLIPEFIANRLQGALASDSVIKRLAFFEDGIKLFYRSPIIGLGIGAFENGIKSVQSFYYETKYAHNHYFQSMLETGIVGLLLFLGMFVSSAVAIWKSRNTHPYVPMLGASLVFMAGQAMHDIVFSSYAYLPVAYGTFALISLSCGESLEKPKFSKTVMSVFLGVVAACTVVYCGFLAGNLMAKREMDTNPTMQTLVQSARLDRFEWTDYALSYVINATGDNVNPYVRQQADYFAERLAKVDSNTVPIYLAQYYFKSDRPEQAIAMLEKYVDYVSSDQTAWQETFDLLRSYEDDSETYRIGVKMLSDKLDSWNAKNIGEIKLNNETQAYIEKYR